MARLPQADLIGGLAKVVGAEHVSTSHPDMVAYSGDFWPKLQIWKMGGDVARYPPDCVVWPADEAEIARVLRFCAEQRIPVIPYGGGSGVVGGTVPIHGGVVLDVKRLCAVPSIDAASYLVRAEPGVNGQHMEDYLDEAGFTLGHFPSSIMCSTVGGWLAARSAGQFSSRYGKIEDMVVSVRCALPDGSVLDTADRAVSGPDWTQLLVGAEGTLGVITSAVLKIHAKPEARSFRGFKFHRLTDALRAMRLVMQAGLRPMVLRLYDPFDSLIALGHQKEPDAVGSGGDGRAAQGLGAATGAANAGSPNPPSPSKPAPSRANRLRKRVGHRLMAYALDVPGVVNRVADLIPSPCLMIIGFEGAEEVVGREGWRAHQIIVEAGGEDGGAALGEAWFADRYAVSFKQSKIYQWGAFVDTMEVATTWDRIATLYHEVRRALSPYVFIMAHFSHAYREGCSVYFTFAGHRRQTERAEALYDRIWAVALETAHRAGATASHHHGIGLAKKHAMVEEHGELLRVWRALKDTLDPRGIMNPGKLFPDGAGAP